MNPNYTDIQLGPAMDCNRQALFGSVELTAKLPGTFQYLEIGLAFAGTFSGVIKAIERNRIDPWMAYGIDKAVGGWEYRPEMVASALAKWNPDFSGQPSGITNRPQIHTCGSVEFLRRYSPGHHFNFVLIDGCHSTGCCTQDFVLVEPLVKPGGIVMFHDADAGQQGPDFDVQPHCKIGIGVRQALISLDILGGGRPGWRVMDDTVPTEAHPGRGSVFIQKT